MFVGVEPLPKKVFSMDCLYIFISFFKERFKEYLMWISTWTSGTSLVIFAKLFVKPFKIFVELRLLVYF